MVKSKHVQELLILAERGILKNSSASKIFIVIQMKRRITRKNELLPWNVGEKNQFCNSLHCTAGKFNVLSLGTSDL
jgi:hypothetical protein